MANIDQIKVDNKTYDIEGKPKYHTHDYTQIKRNGNSTYGPLPIDRSLFDVHRSCKTAFLPADAIKIEYTINNGKNWTLDTTTSNSQKEEIFAMLHEKGHNLRFGNSKIANQNYGLRITIEPIDRYVSLDTFYCWFCAYGANCEVKIERSTIGAKDTFSLIKDWTRIDGWSGANEIIFPYGTFGGGDHQDSNSYKYRMTFRIKDIQKCTTSPQITDIRFYGDNAWWIQNNMGTKDHIYSWDELQNAIFPKKIIATNSGEIPFESDNISSKLVKFSDGETFQQKYDKGELKGLHGGFSSKSSYPPETIIRYLTNSTSWSQSEINEPKGDKWKPGNIIFLAVKCNNGDVYVSLQEVIAESQLKPLTYWIEKKGATGPQGKPGPQGPVGIPNERLKAKDTRDDNQTPNWYMLNYGQSIITEFKYCAKIKVNSILTGTYCNVTTIIPWGDQSGGMPVQFAVNTSNDGIGAYRCSNAEGNDWTSWKKLGAVGPAGKDGTSATHSWSGTTLSITSASGTSSANLKGEKGDKGLAGNGISSIAATDNKGSSDKNTVTVHYTDKANDTFNVYNGARGADGKDGKDGKDGTSATHSWSGTTLSITSASGTSSANLKGEKGDKPKKGVDYFTTAEINDIADKASKKITPEGIGAANSKFFPNDAGEVKTKYRVANKGYNTSTIYYPLCSLPVNDSGNYASLIINGRIGGWVDSNMSSISALVWNRGSVGIALLDIAGSAPNMKTIFDVCDIVVYQESSNAAKVYLKCSSYYTYDINLELYQSTANIIYNEKSIIAPPGTLKASASTSTKRVEMCNGELLVAGKKAIVEGDSRLTNSRPASDVYSWAKAKNKPSYSKNEVGLGNVDNTADNQKIVKEAGKAGIIKDKGDKRDLFLNYSAPEKTPLYLASWTESGVLGTSTPDQIKTKLNIPNRIKSGSWTPRVKNATIKVSSAQYTLIGDSVLLSFYISGTFTSSANQDNVITIEGLPVEPLSEGYGGGVCYNGWLKGPDLYFMGWGVKVGGVNIIGRVGKTYPSANFLPLTEGPNENPGKFFVVSGTIGYKGGVTSSSN